MEALSGENSYEYYKSMDDEIQGFIRRDTWEIFSRKSVDDHNVLPVTWYFKWKRKYDWMIRKFKEKYCARGYVHKRLSYEPLNSYSTVVQWATVRLMLISQCIIGFYSQSIDFANAFTQVYIPIGEPVFVGLPRGLNSDGRNFDILT